MANFVTERFVLFAVGAGVCVCVCVCLRCVEGKKGRTS